MKNGLRYTLLLSLLAIVAACLSCDEDNIVDPVDPVEYDTTYVREYDYQEGRIFDLGYPEEFAEGDRVIDLEIFEHEPRLDNLEAFDCVINIYGDSVNPGGTIPYASQSEEMRMDRVDYSRYYFYNDPHKRAPYVVLDSAHWQGSALGAWIVIERADGSRDTVGDISTDAKVLKTLRSSPLRYFPDHKTWSLMWRNTYSIPRNHSLNDLAICIKKGMPGTETDPYNLDYQVADNGGAEGKYLQILGLDQYNNVTDARVPDDIVDERIEVFSSEWGLLIFPHRTPFDCQDTAFYNEVYLMDVLPWIYEYGSLYEKASTSVYYIQIIREIRDPYP